MGRLGPNWRRIALIVASVAVMVGIALVVRALSAPVEQVGVPTLPVPSPSGTQAGTPSPSPSVGGTTSPTTGSSPTASAEPTATSTMKSSGSFTWSTATAPAAGSQGELYRYAVAAETSAGIKPDSAAGTIASVLNDPRSWTGTGTVRFALVGKAKATTTVYLASPKTATGLCGSDARAADGCVRGDTVVINAERWKTAAPAYAGDAAGYRTYLINQAVGKLLGKAAARCSGNGKKAPVMMPQSAGLDGCTPNPWP